MEVDPPDPGLLKRSYLSDSSCDLSSDELEGAGLKVSRPSNFDWNIAGPKKSKMLKHNLGPESEVDRIMSGPDTARPNNVTGRNNSGPGLSFNQTSSRLRKIPEWSSNLGKLVVSDFGVPTEVLEAAQTDLYTVVMWFLAEEIPSTLFTNRKIFSNLYRSSILKNFKLVGFRPNVTKHCIALDLENAIEFPKLETINLFGGYSVKCSLPLNLQIKSGILFDVDTEYTAEEIKSEIVSGNPDIQVSKVDRFLSKVNNTAIPTKTVRIDFQDNLPNHVYMFYRRYKVVQFVPKPVRCFRCQLFGHMHLQCKLKSQQQRCAKCGLDHKEADCTPEVVLFCSNCRGNHPTYSKDCPAFIEAKLVSKISVRHSIRYSDAVKIVHNQTRERSSRPLSPPARPSNSGIGVNNIPRNSTTTIQTPATSAPIPTEQRRILCDNSSQTIVQCNVSTQTIALSEHTPIQISPISNTSTNQTQSCPPAVVNIGLVQATPESKLDIPALSDILSLEQMNIIAKEILNLFKKHAKNSGGIPEFALTNVFMKAFNPRENRSKNKDKGKDIPKSDSLPIK
ncbi:unnamed protein product [Rotaria socialis]|uniref:Gag-like protein n=1 Tax=Rotaria socialis TaxID=392032 RepID=A0A818C6D9_9BILA|nr:unnamed protein product [Rotaria socialis]CAF4770003.1 unnamed protein product [Rotaria socialis]